MRNVASMNAACTIAVTPTSTAPTILWTTMPGSRLVDLDTCNPDRVSPFSSFRLQVRGEFGRTAADDVEALAAKTFLCFRGMQNFDRGGVQLADDVPRRAFGRKHAEPSQHFVGFHSALGNSRQI